MSPRIVMLEGSLLFSVETEETTLPLRSVLTLKPDLTDTSGFGAGVCRGCPHRVFAPDDESIHNATMTIKNAGLLALIGTLLLTILLAADFINTVWAFLHDVIPAMALLRSLVYWFASLGVTVFFYIFNRTQSR